MKRAIRSCKFRRDLPELGESGVYIEDPTMKKRKKNTHHFPHLYNNIQVMYYRSLSLVVLTVHLILLSHRALRPQIMLSTFRVCVLPSGGSGFGWFAEWGGEVESGMVWSGMEVQISLSFGV